jgi:GntR family transcriptional regulator
MTKRPARGPIRRGQSDPLFVQIRDHVLDQIAAGVYVDDQPLPSERVLAADLKVSRLTLRRAFVALAEAGVLKAQVGRGWFVTRKVSEPNNALTSFTQMVKAAGREPSTQLLSFERRAGTTGELRALHRTKQIDVFDMRRLRLVDGEPMARDHTRVAADVAEGLESGSLENGSLYRALEALGITPTAAEYRISACSADEELSRLLNVPQSAPLLVLRQVTRDASGEAFEIAETIYRVDHYQFRGTLLRAGVAAPPQAGFSRPGTAASLVGADIDGPWPGT